MLRKYNKLGKALEKELKIKPLTKEQLVISLDRLTRFKPTEEKYLRVFKDLIISNLIAPKFKKKELDLIPYEELRNFAQEVINFSIQELKSRLGLPAQQQEAQINKKILEYEKSVFKFDKNVETLLDNNIDYISAIKMISSSTNLPRNLKWLISLSKNVDSIEERANFGLKFPISKLVLVEGITEEILLPKFALQLGFDFNKKGIFIISAGGKNPVVKLFYKFAGILKLPIFVLLDNDAMENYEEILPKLRKSDLIHVLKSGEFEDTLPLTLIKRTLNKIFDDCDKVNLADLREDLRMTQILEEIFKSRGLEFKKAEFALHVAENIATQNDVSLEIQKVIEELSNL